MERITKELPNGTWKIDGIDWKDVPGTMYGALCKLRDYEKTNLNPAEIEILAEKAKKLALLNEGRPPRIEQKFAHCPNCYKLLGMAKSIVEDFFCDVCGQHIFFNKERWIEENADKSE